MFTFLLIQYAVTSSCCIKTGLLCLMNGDRYGQQVINKCHFKVMHQRAMTLQKCALDSPALDFCVLRDRSYIIWKRFNEEKRN